MRKMIEKLYSFLGTANYSRGNMENAIKWFGKACRSRHCAPRTKTSYAYLLLKTGSIERAEKTLTDLLNTGLQQDDEMHAKSNLALVFWKKGNLDKAVAMLEEVIDNYENSTVYGSLGYLLILKGDLDRALDFNLKAYEYNSSNTVILDNLGQTYYLKGDYDKALEIYENLMQKKPSFPEAYYSYGLVLRAKGNTQKAVEFMKKALNYRLSFLSTVTREEMESTIEEMEVNEK